MRQTRKKPYSTYIPYMYSSIMLLIELEMFVLHYLVVFNALWCCSDVAVVVVVVVVVTFFHIFSNFASAIHWISSFECCSTENDVQHFCLCFIHLYKLNRIVFRISHIICPFAAEMPFSSTKYQYHMHDVPIFNFSCGNASRN